MTPNHTQQAASHADADHNAREGGRVLPPRGDDPGDANAALGRGDRAAATLAGGTGGGGGTYDGMTRWIRPDPIRSLEFPYPSPIPHTYTIQLAGGLHVEWEEGGPSADDTGALRYVVDRVGTRDYLRVCTYIRRLLITHLYAHIHHRPSSPTRRRRSRALLPTMPAVSPVPMQCF